jgi:DNA mismatch endonuclease (patch repair protein)
MDVVDPAKRSKMMAGIKSKNTQPEIIVRKFLHARGFRYRLHTRKLPGSPDIVLPKYKVAIFVHGCFWHRHAHCRYTTSPSTNVERWVAKFEGNVERDFRNQTKLHELGWKVIVVWECELRSNAVERLDRLAIEVRQGLSTTNKKADVADVPSTPKVRHLPKETGQVLRRGGPP